MRLRPWFVAFSLTHPEVLALVNVVIVLVLAFAHWYLWAVVYAVLALRWYRRV